MPIRPENRARYPKNWSAISQRIRARAGNRCEGSPAYPDCRAENHKPHPETGSKVVLTVAHLDHRPENCDDENLRAWCQRCHNTYDAAERRKGIRERRSVGQLALGLVLGGGRSLALLAALCTGPAAADDQIETTCSTAICITGTIEVWDGDTWRAHGHRWRLWGVSAPERYADGGLEAKLALAAIIGDGPLACEPHGTSYDRTVVRCWLSDGRDLSCAMIESGYATEATSFSGGAYAGCVPRARKEQ